VDVSLFDYELPPERIAQQPLAERDASRLLVLDRKTGSIRHQVFRDLPDLLDPDDLVVANRSRVFPARLLGRREGGGAAEVMLVRDRKDGTWDALLRPGRRLREGARIRVADDLSIEVLDSSEGAVRQVRLESPEEVSAALDRHGHVPLPPYIHREDRPEDRDRYQTIYARETGSVAAPTAGLHFTPPVRARLAERGVQWSELVLHVGPGTFRPVEVDRVEDHTVDAERFELPPETAEAIARSRSAGRRVVSVGTTTTRVLESALGPEGDLRAGGGETGLVIFPGFHFRAVDALLTNFHLPRSSLLLLVSAFAGRERILAAYAEAIRAGYRFYSYGDAMLIL
jgi:S-adenosylmethionine:tRNA ribosyltransferase-isomerase